MNTLRDWMRELTREFGDRVKEKIPLAPFTTLKVGGPADCYLEITKSEELITALKIAKKIQCPVFILGGGSNILVSDSGIRGLTVKNSARSISVKGVKSVRTDTKQRETVFLEADSGVVMNSLVRYSIEEGFGGLEMHLGLPGTVGGALYMNSKWMKPVGYVGDAVYQATVVDSDGDTRTVSREFFRFGYDTSVLQTKRAYVVSVVFALNRESREKLWQTANESISYRRQTQPQGVKTAGCTFRNISLREALSVPTPDNTTSAGYLIDRAGLKGYGVGGARVSPVHANFIENTGTATASDIVQLIEHIRSVVFRKFGVTLREEIIRVGDF